jgi:hypothetical protein
MSTCCVCRRRRRGYAGTDCCARCIEDIRARVRCPDCDSIVTMVFAEGFMAADLRRDATCPSWLSRQQTH